MNYFASLLLAAGLPVTVSTPLPLTPAAVPATTFPIMNTMAPVATVQGAYATMLAQSMPSPVSPGSSVPVAPAPGASVPSSPLGAASPSNSVNNQNMAALANEMIQLINQAREQNGLQPYTVNPTLMALAQKRAEALANGPFTSDLPPYGWPIQMELAAGINAQGMGAENIAEAQSVQQAFALLMADPPHRANILNPYETQIGVGVAPWGSGIAISELFIGPNL
ncbi:MAG: CAP domain-containing protein [Firmicutes bacterium]|nr:CAP domain-containing protein [Bacillota bacterium]